MKKSLKNLTIFVSLGLFSASLTAASFTGSFEVARAVSGYENGDSATYYKSISSDLEGDDLLSALRELNSSKRKTTPGYSGLWNYYSQTDYDPDDPSKYLAFYRGSSASRSEMNKEHVWPNSHGGNLVEGDIHMTRPTLQSDNSSRGNSFYVEGMNDSSQGWDPKTAGMTESYRGDCARIVFYCVVASSQLSLVNVSYSYTTNKNPDYKMGKLSDLLKWNLNYPVQTRENNRNEGAESVQGNRNPFIDHPDYACKIWGRYDDETRAICGYDAEDEATLTDLTVSGTLQKSTYSPGETFDPAGLVVTAVFSDKSTKDVTSSVKWDPEELDITVSRVTGSYTYHGVTKTVSVPVTVTDGDIDSATPVDLVVSGSLTKSVYKPGETFDPTGLVVTVIYSDSAERDVTSEVVWDTEPLETGTTKVSCRYNFGNSYLKAYAYITVTNGYAQNGCRGSAMASSSLLFIISLAGAAFLKLKKESLR